MIEGRYTAKEIEEMRSAVRGLMTGWSFSSPSPKNEDIERRLLTHMQNGTTAEELEELAKEHRRANRKLAQTAAACNKERGLDPLGRPLKP